MGKIFCIIGKSGSGKDTVFNLILENKDIELTPVVSYTTRSIRSGEENGVQYYFITENELNQYEKENKVIEKRCYSTIHGPWYYCIIDDGQIDLDKKDSIIVSTLEGYINMKEYFGTKNIVPIYIYVDDGTRLERCLEREKEQEDPKYREMCRRFLSDETDFEEFALRKTHIDKRYRNYILQECVDEIIKDIKESSHQ